LTVLRRAWTEQGDDNIGLLAAGVSFYGFLALVPMLGALVLTYGVVANPETVLRNVRNLAEVMPVGAAKLVGEQPMNAVTASTGKKGLGLLLALAIALFGARNAAGGVITALNVA
jgi:membrane protein